jgi:hypothetical protein
MKHAREDYNRIQDPDGKIPEMEPVFLLRGQDICAPLIVTIWAAVAEIEGASPKIVDAARKQADAMRRWQASRLTRSKIPDMPDAD